MVNFVMENMNLSKSFTIITDNPETHLPVHCE